MCMTSSRQSRELQPNRRTLRSDHVDAFAEPLVRQWRYGLAPVVALVGLVARILDRACAHPAPHQHDILVRGVVEAVPTAARRINHVAFDRRLLAEIAVDVALALDDDEELVAVAMQVPLVAGAGLEHGPADEAVCARRLLVGPATHLS